MPHRTLAAAAFAGLLATAVPVAAADIYELPGGFLQSVPELTPVEIGSGWYLRGDVSYDRSADSRASFDAVSPGVGSLPLGELRLDDGFSGGGGVGYQFTDFLRADITARYGRSDLRAPAPLAAALCIDGPCGIVEAGRVRSWDLMANAYVDLGTFAGFTPYVGAGAGAVNFRFDDGAFGCNQIAVPACAVSAEREDEWRFAYSLSAGVAYAFNRALSLDVGYRYLDVEGGDGYQLVSTTPFQSPAQFTLADSGFERHSIQAGLRYKIW